MTRSCSYIRRRLQSPVSPGSTSHGAAHAGLLISKLLQATGTDLRDRFLRAGERNGRVSDAFGDAGVLTFGRFGALFLSSVHGRCCRAKASCRKVIDNQMTRCYAMVIFWLAFG